MSTPTVSSREYLEALYGKCTSGQIVFIEPTRNKVSGYFNVNRLDLAAQHIDRAPLNLFIKVNVMDHAATLARDRSAIGGTAEVKAIVSFHLDVDAGKNDKYLTREKMLEAIGEMSIEPSAIIETNGDTGGFHAYWMLEQPHYIESQEDRQRCQDISNRWLTELRDFASPGTIDGTANIDRILRPVGSLRPSGNRVRASVWNPDRRYQINDFLLPEIAKPDQVFEPRHDGESVIEKYLDAVGENHPATLLQRHAGYAHVRDSFYIRPGSESGAPTGEVYQRSDGSLGFTFKSGACDPFTSTNKNGTNGNWYSAAAIYVMLCHGNDWKAAAKHCYDFFRPVEDYSYTETMTANGAPATTVTTTAKTDDSKSNSDALEPISITALHEAYPKLREPVVHGILRVGETANIIASPKVGKSFLAGNLAWSVATGRPWLSHNVEQGRVLILDNELHPETLASRLTHIADEMQISLDDRDAVDVISLRGRLTPVDALEITTSIKPGVYSLVVLDALYRTIPVGTSENDNAGMMAIYNHLDKLADRWQSAIVVVHHSSKGAQGDKSLTDMGAGAGAISRAADTHIAIRPHETEGHFVLEAVTRSFKSPEPVSISFDWPVWHATTLTPEVKRPTRQNQSAQAQADKAASALILDAIPLEPKSIQQNRLRESVGFGPDKMNRLVGGLIRDKKVRLVRRRKKGGSRPLVFYSKLECNSECNSDSDSESSPESRNSGSGYVVPEQNHIDSIGNRWDP